MNLEETLIVLVILVCGTIMVTFGKDEDGYATSTGLLLISIALGVLGAHYIF